MKQFAAVVLVSMFSASAALAAGGGGGGNGVVTAPTPMKAKCKTGEVVKMVKKNGKMVPTCVKVTGSLLDDGDLYHQGWVLAKAGEYEWAIQVLSAVKNQNDPDVLNMLGYSNRKAGRLELGISYYDKALAMKPDFARAREYLGEGYVAAGKLDLAKDQLGEIQKICGTTCDEYKDLSKIIDSSTL